MGKVIVKALGKSALCGVVIGILFVLFTIGTGMRSDAAETWMEGLLLALIGMVTMAFPITVFDMEEYRHGND